MLVFVGVEGCQIRARLFRLTIQGANPSSEAAVKAFLVTL